MESFNLSLVRKPSCRNFPKIYHSRLIPRGGILVKMNNRQGKGLYSESKSKEISHNLGFSSRQYFSSVFKRVTGVSLVNLFGKRANKRKNLFFRLIQIIVGESPELGVPGNHR